MSIQRSHHYSNKLLVQLQNMALFLLNLDNPVQAVMTNDHEQFYEHFEFLALNHFQYTEDINLSTFKLGIIEIGI